MLSIDFTDSSTSLFVSILTKYLVLFLILSHSFLNSGSKVNSLRRVKYVRFLASAGFGGRAVISPLLPQEPEEQSQSDKEENFVADFN
jgi:hypothetical protein